MKKTLLASIFAGLFTFGAIAGDADDGHYKVMVEIEADNNSPTVIQIDNDGQMQTFEFTPEELKDMTAVEASLADLDERTRTTILNALKGVNFGHGNMMFPHGDGDERVMIVKHMDGSHSDEEGKIVIKLDGAHGSYATGDGMEGLHHIIKHKMIKHEDGDIVIHKMGEHGQMLHHDSSHTVKMIEKLLKHSDLSAEQLADIQQMLDDK